MILAGSIVVSFFVTFLFMVALRPLAFVLGFIDRPGGRKSHIGDVPVIGGVAMFVGVIVALGLVSQEYDAIGYLVAASGLLVAVGMLDDRFAISASIRLVVQTAAVLIMVIGGEVYLTDLGYIFGNELAVLGWMSIPLTVLVSVAVINAFNLVDGVDGLAGSLAVVPLVAVALVSLNDTPLLTICCVAVAAIASFLLFNFPTIANRRLRSFMGDSGSTFLGLIVVWMTTLVSQGETREIAPVIGLWFAAIPIFDLFACFVRRMLRGKSPFHPGRDHFHHTLKRSGMGVRRVLFVLTSLQATYASIGLAGHFAEVPEQLLFATWAILGIFQHHLIRRAAVWYRWKHWGEDLTRAYT